jgi:hypothetical protein
MLVTGSAQGTNIFADPQGYCCSQRGRPCAAPRKQRACFCRRSRGQQHTVGEGGELRDQQSAALRRPRQDTSTVRRAGVTYTEEAWRMTTRVLPPPDVSLARCVWQGCKIACTDANLVYSYADICQLFWCRHRALTVQLQQAKTPGSAGKSRAGPQPRLWSVNLRLKPAGEPYFCGQEPARPDTLLASVAPGSLDARHFAFDQVLHSRTLFHCRGCCWTRDQSERQVSQSLKHCKLDRG